MDRTKIDGFTNIIFSPADLADADASISVERLRIGLGVAVLMELVWKVPRDRKNKKPSTGKTEEQTARYEWHMKQQMHDICMTFLRDPLFSYADSSVSSSVLGTKLNRLELRCRTGRAPSL